MLLAVLIGLILTASGTLSKTPQLSDSGFWKGKFEIYQYNFVYGTGVRDPSLVTRETQLWKFDYDFYANDQGVVREELMQMNRNRSLEGPLDVRLLDYDRNEAVLFDKGGKQETKGPLAPSGTSQDLGARRIMGFLCGGKEYRWRTFQNADVQLQRWRAQDSTLKVPLLELEYFTDATGALLSMRVQVISKVEPTSQLPSSLFMPPSGLKVVQVPDVE